jgi:hypothetical protein
MTKNLPLTLPGTWLVLTLALVNAPIGFAAAEVGSLAGTISNASTGNLLEGARVEVSPLGLAALTDNTGRYTLSNVPAGEHEVVVSYIGLDPLRARVTVASGQRTARNFDLTSAIYKLDAFKVTG